MKRLQQNTKTMIRLQQVLNKPMVRLQGNSNKTITRLHQVFNKQNKIKDQLNNKLIVSVHAEMDVEVDQIRPKVATERQQSKVAAQGCLQPNDNDEVATQECLQTNIKDNVAVQVCLKTNYNNKANNMIRLQHEANKQEIPVQPRAKMKYKS